MKRLIFCFDGSWNKINTDNLTNVALTAAAIGRSQTVETTDEKLIDRGLMVGEVIPQIVHYDEGVGTNRKDKYGGGIFGKGLYENVREAYIFLCLNYEPGDELYLFGFSRGAYTARSFAGLVGNCGIMRGEHIEKVIEAASLYKERGEARTQEDRESLQERLFTLIRHYGHPVTTCEAEAEWKRCKHGLEDHNHPMVDIRFIGLWDTVKTTPTLRNMFGMYDPDTEFHDENIPECASSGRHAVALDEHRASFDVTLWDNIEEANRAAMGRLGGAKKYEDYEVDRERAFQEVWFPGTHGAVGGGGERRGLSDTALLWVLDGAREQGLQINTDAESKVFKLQPTPIDYLDNTKHDGAMEAISDMKKKVKGPFIRIGPSGLHEVSDSTIARMAAPASVLPVEEERDKDAQYRPAALRKLTVIVETEANQRFTLEDFDLYNGYADSDFEVMQDRKKIEGWNYGLYTVKKDDRLSDIALSELGNDNWRALQAVNKVMVPDPDRVHPGQVLSIPILDRLYT